MKDFLNLVLLLVTSNSTTSSIHGLRLKAAGNLATPLLEPDVDLEAQLPAAVAPAPRAAADTSEQDGRLCMICLSEEPLPDVKCNSDCTAEFHEGCLRDWLIRHNNSCPQCRHQPMEYVNLETGEVLTPQVTHPASTRLRPSVNVKMYCYAYLAFVFGASYIYWH